MPDGQKGIVDCCASTSRCGDEIETELAGQTLAFVCLTHPHYDHGKDIPKVLEACTVKELWHSLPDIQPYLYWVSEAPTFRSSVHKLANDSRVSQADFIAKIWAEALKREIEIKSLDASRKEEEIGGVRIHFLGPARKVAQAELIRIRKAINQVAKGPQDLNNFSLVIAFQYAGKVALLCADALKDHWKDAFKELQRAKIQKASILKVPHHGASNAFHLNPKFKHDLNSWDLCEGKPVAVLFAGDINHPDLEVLNELQKRTHLFSLFDPFAVGRNTSPITLDTIGAEPVPTGRRQLRHCRVIVQIDASGQISYSTVDV